MPPTATQQTMDVDMDVMIIKQHAGPVTAQRRVKVNVPGRFFSGLQPAEQKESYAGEAVEYTERHKFEAHSKGWGAAHSGPGIRFLCVSDAVDDPDNKGFWSTLTLFNRWRHDTYKTNRDAELQYLDALPNILPVPTDAAVEKHEPLVKSFFTLDHIGVHTVGGTGKMAGKQLASYFYLCNKEGCLHSHASKAIKQVGTGTGRLFGHLDACQPAAATKIRGLSKHSSVDIDADTGEEYELHTFQELLPHHARFVEKAFRGFDHFNETRADNGLLEWVRGYERRASLPARETCIKLLEVYEELYDENIRLVVAAHTNKYGSPNCGSACDLWSLKSCRSTFGCYRGSWCIDGDMLSELRGMPQYKGTILDLCPILSFECTLEFIRPSIADVVKRYNEKNHPRLDAAPNVHAAAAAAVPLPAALLPVAPLPVAPLPVAPLPVAPIRPTVWGV